MKISKVQERIQLWALMYNHKGPFYALARSISGQRWNDILCCLWGIKDTLWVKGSQLLRWLQTGRSLVWNLNTNSDSKTKFLPVPLAWERLAWIVRVNRAGGLPQGEADKPQWFQCSRDQGLYRCGRTHTCQGAKCREGRHQVAKLGRKQWGSEVLQEGLLSEEYFEENFVLFRFMLNCFFLVEITLWSFTVSICLHCYDTGMHESCLCSSYLRWRWTGLGGHSHGIFFVIEHHQTDRRGLINSCWTN